jgi:hypothetical protein
LVILQHHAKQAIDQSSIAGRATDRYVRARCARCVRRRFASTASRCNSGRPAIPRRRDTLQLWHAGRSNGFGLAPAPQSDGFASPVACFDVGIRLQFGDAHALLGTDHLLLDVGEGGLAHELLTLLLRGHLNLVGLALFLGDLAIGLSPTSVPWAD